METTTMSMDVHAMAIAADRKLLVSQNERARCVAEGFPSDRRGSSGLMMRMQVVASALQRSVGHQIQALRQVRAGSAAAVMLPDEGQA
jgi:hypothetical protein